ncbi:hypothetical protein AJ87_37525 [Rhizobium yanglingense]|nr:hypothetical protein AJ87_37525 [Rhizobium yanglingense]
MGAETEQIRHFAEFGVVMMLFLVGLELEPRQMWGMRHRLIGLGGLQVAVTAAAVLLAATLIGVDWKIGLAVGDDHAEAARMGED